MSQEIIAIFLDEELDEENEGLVPIGGIWEDGDRVALVTDDDDLREAWGTLQRKGVPCEAAGLIPIKGQYAVGTRDWVEPLSAGSVGSALGVLGFFYTLPGASDWEPALAGYSAKFPDPPDEEEGDESAATAIPEATAKHTS